MELDYALLADAAQISEGKTYILGGGVSILWRSQFPTILGCAFVAQLTYHRSEAGTRHALRINVVDADGNPLLPELRAELELGEPLPNLPANVPLVVPLVVPFPDMPVVQRAGAYSVDVLIDDRHVKSLPFAAVHPPADA